MFAIGTLSDRSGVKIPTIRFYEDKGLLSKAERTGGNQRRYHQSDLDRLAFIKHARDLGFSLGDIQALIHLQDHPDLSCDEATYVAQAHLADTREKIARLIRLEVELTRIATGCAGNGTANACTILSSLSDHRHCETEH